MTQYIQNKDGTFAGSIGDGKTKVPTPAPSAPGVSSTAPDFIDEGQLDDYYNRFQGTRLGHPDQDDDGGIARAQAIEAFTEISSLAGQRATTLRATVDRLKSIHDARTTELEDVKLKYAHLDIEDAIRAEEDRGTRREALHTHYYQQHPNPQNIEGLRDQLVAVRAQQGNAGPASQATASAASDTTGR
jgi:hypothetical protein